METCLLTFDHNLLKKSDCGTLKPSGLRVIVQSKKSASGYHGWGKACFN